MIYILLTTTTVMSTLCLNLNLSGMVCGGDLCGGLVSDLTEFESGRFFSAETIATVYNNSWQPCDGMAGFNNETTINCEQEGGDATLSEQLCLNTTTTPLPPTSSSSSDDDAVIVIVVVFIVIGFLIVIIYIICRRSSKGLVPHLNDLSFQKVIQADREARPQLQKYYASNATDKDEPLLEKYDL